ncbi:MAG: PAS domain S-box protein, partial [Spirochaetaceae bacterium]
MDTQALLSNLPVPVAVHRIVLDGKGLPIDYEYVYANEAFCELLGMTAADLIGRRVTDVLPGTEKDPADWIGRYGKIALGGPSENFEQFSQALNKWFRVHAFQTQQEHFATLAEDITNRKIAEDTLREQQEQYRSLLSRAKDVVYRFELFPEGHFQYISPSILDISGYSDQEFYDDPKLVSKIILPDDLPLLQNLTQRKKTQQIPVRLRWRQKSGNIAWVEQRAVYHLNKEGEIAAIEGLVRDVTDEVETQNALQRSQLQLSQILAAVSDIVLFYEKDDLRISWANRAAEESANAASGSLSGCFCHAIWGKETPSPCTDCPVVR